MIALLAACVHPDTPDSRIDCAVDTSDHPRAAALQAIVDGRVERGLPGLAVAVRTAEGVWQGAAGFADLEHGVAMTPCHVHPLASVGKTWTAALALRLADQGVLDVDARLADLVPASLIDGVPNADRVTLRQLMDHGSGIPDFNEDMGYLTHEFDGPLAPDAPVDLLDWVRGDPALSAPDRGYAYADTNLLLVALAIDAVTGDFHRAMDEEVVGPLGLAQTSFPERGDPDPVGRVNSYWEVGGGRLENVSDFQAEYDVLILGAGNVRSTPVEALTFVESVVRGDLLPDDLRAQMMTVNPYSEDDDGYGYGLGLARRVVHGADGDVTLWGHTGGDVGAGSFVEADADSDVAVVGITNLGMFLGGPLGAQFDDALLAELVDAAR